MGALILLGSSILFFIIGAIVSIMQTQHYPGDVFLVTLCCLVIFGVEYDRYREENPIRKRRK